MEAEFRKTSDYRSSVFTQVARSLKSMWAVFFFVCQYFLSDAILHLKCMQPPNMSVVLNHSCLHHCRHALSLLSEHWLYLTGLCSAQLAAT